jgi:hypothetical protein
MSRAPIWKRDPFFLPGKMDTEGGGSRFHLKTKQKNFGMSNAEQK